MSPRGLFLRHGLFFPSLFLFRENEPPFSILVINCSPSFSPFLRPGRVNGLPSPVPTPLYGYKEIAFFQPIPSPPFFIPMKGTKGIVLPSPPLRFRPRTIISSPSGRMGIRQGPPPFFSRPLEGRSAKLRSFFFPPSAGILPRLPPFFSAYTALPSSLGGAGMFFFVNAAS